MPAFVTYELGELQPGVAVEVTPEQAGNVLLMDPHNLGLYRKGRRGRAIGGPARKGVPVRLIVPHKDVWAVIVDMGGARGKIRAAVKTLDPATIDADVSELVGPRLSAQDLLNGGRRR
jgi:uncharacterized protein DUF1883